MAAKTSYWQHCYFEVDSFTVPTTLYFYLWCPFCTPNCPWTSNLSSERSTSRV